MVRESRYKDPKTSKFKPPSNTVVGFARSIVSEQSQFSAYIPKAGRLTLIDPVTLNERWGLQVGNSFIDAVPLTNYDGIALAGSTEVRVYAGNNYRSFPLNSFAENSSWAVAQDAPTMAFTSQTGKSISLIKHLSGVDWQEATILPPEITESQNVGTLISKSGLLMMVITSPQGSYAIYKSQDRISRFDTTTTQCTAFNPADSNPTVFRAGLIDETKKMALLADGNQSIFFLDISSEASCSDPALWNKLTFSANANYITQLTSGKFVAALDNGSFSVFSVNDKVGSLEDTIQTPCSSAIGSAEGKDGLLFIRCTGQVHSYKINNGGEFELVKSHVFDTKHALTPAFDPSTNSAYYLNNGGLGTVHALNLLTGEKRSKTGLFVKDVFSKK